MLKYWKLIDVHRISSIFKLFLGVVFHPLPCIMHQKLAFEYEKLRESELLMLMLLLTA